VLAQLIEDLLHFERCRIGLNEHSRPDCASGDAELLLGVPEHVVPQSCLEVALQLRQVEVWALTGVELAARAVEEVETEIDQAARHPLAVDGDVLLRQVPAAGTDDDRGEFVGILERVGLALRRGEVDPPLQRVDQVELAADHVLPQWSVGVLEVGQPYVRAAVQCVDGQLGLGWTGDLHPAVDQARRRLSYPPGAVLADVPGLGKEVQAAAGGEAVMPGFAQLEQLNPAPLEGPVQTGKKGKCSVGKYLVVTVVQRSGDLRSRGRVGCRRHLHPSEQ
jgi:hypothetical protein